MATTFFRRLAKATPIAFNEAFGGQPKSDFNKFRFPFGAIAVVAGGVSYYCYFSSPNLVISLENPIGQSFNLTAYQCGLPEYLLFFFFEFKY